MGRIIKNSKGILMSETTKDELTGIGKKAVSALLKDPVAGLELVIGLHNLPSAVRDGIFIENLQVFLLNSCEYNSEKQEFVDSTLTSFVEALAEASPNEEAGYIGNPDKLTEYAKRIVKTIDDCGTIQKSYYLACLARAVRKKDINTSEFFKFAQCIRNLTEEDLLFIKKHITKDVITEDKEYIDDFRALGLMKDVDGGFAYTERAFRLVKYSLDYEGHLELPDKYPDRLKPIAAEPLSKEQIDSLFNQKTGSMVEKAAEKAALKWNEF